MRFIHGNCNCVHDSSFIHKEVMDASFGKRFRLILFKSRCFIELDDKPQGVFDANSLLFVSSDTLFKYGATEGIQLVHDWVEFSTDTNEVSIYGLDHDFIISNINDRFARLLSKIIKEIVRESYGNESNSKRVIGLYLELLLIELARCIEANDNTVTKEENLNPHYRMLCSMRNEILSSVFDNEIVSRTCKKYKISESYFRKLYKSFFYKPIGRDIISKKTMLAQKYLTDSSNYSVTQIAYILGYKNHETFFRQFKKMTGLTPIEYRKKFTGFN